MDLIKLFCREKIMEIFVKINDKSYSCRLYKNENISLSHLNKLVALLTEEEILKPEKSGRVCYLKLTDKGKELQKEIVILLELLKIVNNQSEP